jgi:CDP-paratose synthetase
MTKKFLITGITGYIGSKLAKRLIDEGHEVIGIKRESSSLSVLQGYESKIKFYDYDGSYESLHKALEENPDINCTYHIASWYLREHKPENISELFHSNITFGSHLLEAALTQNCTNFINASSFMIFSENAKKYSPDSLYSATKRAFFDIIEYYTQCRGTNSITLYLYDNYGADDHRKKLFWLFSESLKNNKKIDFTEGAQKMSPIYIDDTIDALIQASKLLEDKQYQNQNLEYFVAGKKYTLKQIAEAYEQAAGKKLNIEWGAIPYRDNQIMDPYAGEILPGWSQKISLEQGMKLLF